MNISCDLAPGTVLITCGVPLWDFHTIQQQRSDGLNNRTWKQILCALPKMLSLYVYTYGSPVMRLWKQNDKNRKSWWRIGTVGRLRADSGQTRGRLRADSGQTVGGPCIDCEQTRADCRKTLCELTFGRLWNHPTLQKDAAMLLIVLTQLSLTKFYYIKLILIENLS